MKFVLVVEDDDTDVQIFLTAAKAAALADVVVVERDAASALKRLESLRPSVIFLDLSMPGMDGFQLLQCIKADPLLQEIPVHVLSTSNAPQDVRRCYQLGAAAYMVKPYSLKQLQRMLVAARHFWASCALPT